MVDSAIASRALEIEKLGLRAVDALHISCAERSSDVMLTTDDEIIKVGNKEERRHQISKWHESSEVVIRCPLK